MTPTPEQIEELDQNLDLFHQILPFYFTYENLTDAFHKAFRRDFLDMLRNDKLFFAGLNEITRNQLGDSDHRSSAATLLCYFWAYANHEQRAEIALSASMMLRETKPKASMDERLSRYQDYQQYKQSVPTP